jgi:hypothetical protein
MPEAQLAAFPELPAGAAFSTAEVAAAYQRTLTPAAAPKPVGAITTLPEAKNYAAAAHKVVKAKVTPALQAANPVAFVQYVTAMVIYSKAYDALDKASSVNLLRQGDAATDQARRYEANPPAAVATPTPTPTPPTPAAPTPTPPAPPPSSGLPSIPFPSAPSSGGAFVPKAPAAPSATAPTAPSTAPAEMPPDVAAIVAFCQTHPSDPQCTALCARAKGTAMVNLPAVQAVCAAVGSEKSNTIWWVVGGVSAAVIAAVIGVAIYKRRKAAAPAPRAPRAPAPAVSGRRRRRASR